MEAVPTPGQDERLMLAAALVSENYVVGKQRMTTEVVQSVMEVCDARLLVEPRNATLWARRSWAYNAQRRPYEALEDARRALDCISKEEGEEETEKIVEKSSASFEELESRILLNVGLALLQLGQVEEAIKCYDHAESMGADAKLCGRMRERCLEFSASVALAGKGSPRPPVRFKPPPPLDSLHQASSERRATDLIEAAERQLSEDCQLLISLQKSPTAADAAAAMAAQRMKPALAVLVDCAEQGSPTGVNDSPSGIEDARPFEEPSARPYQPYKKSFSDDVPNSPNCRKKRKDQEAEMIAKRARSDQAPMLVIPGPL